MSTGLELEVPVLAEPAGPATTRARIAMAEKWVEVAHLASRAAKGDVDSCLQVAARAEDESRFDSVATRALKACVERCSADAERVGEDVGWPSSDDDCSPFGVELAKLARLKASAHLFIEGSKLTDDCLRSSLIGPVEMRFDAFFFKNHNLLFRDRPEVPGRWLAQVFSRAERILSGSAGSLSALDELRLALGRMAAIVVRRALPFKDAVDANRHLDAMVDLEHSIFRPGLLLSGGPLSVVAEEHLDSWAQSDATHIEERLTATLEKQTTTMTHEAMYGDAALAIIDAFPKRTRHDHRGGARGLVSWDVACIILSTMRRYRSLSSRHRRPLCAAALLAASTVLKDAAREATFTAEDVNTVVWSRLKQQQQGKYGDAAESRWLRAVGLDSILYDVANEIDSIVMPSTTDEIEEEEESFASTAADLLAEVDAFADKVAGFARSIARTAGRRHGSFLATERWLEAFLDEAADRFCPRACGACHAKLLEANLADLVANADTSVAKRAQALYRIFLKHRPVDAVPFLDVSVLASLDVKRRRTLVFAFEDLCLVEEDRDLSLKKRKQDLDAALAIVDEAVDAQLRAMLATAGVQVLQPRAAASVLLASLSSV